MIKYRQTLANTCIHIYTYTKKRKEGRKKEEERTGLCPASFLYTIENKIKIKKNAP